MCRTRILCATLLTGAFAVSAAAQVQLPAKIVYERIEQAKAHVARAGGGHVIVGRVVLEEGDDPTLVVSQMLILPGGVFVSDTADLIRPVGFRMHQYAPYDLELKGKRGDLVDVGVIRMRRLSPSELVPVEGKIIFEGGGVPSQATLSLMAVAEPVNTARGGTDPRPRWPSPVEVSIDSSGSFRAAGFSPIGYYLSISGPGLVPRGFEVDLKPGVGHDFGTIMVERARRIVVEYIVSEKGPFKLRKRKQAALAGGERWKVTPDIRGWDLEFVQDEGRVSFDCIFVSCSIADLGEAQLEDFLRIDASSATERPRNVAVNEGHVYLLNSRLWKRMVLFKIVRIEEPH